MKYIQPNIARYFFYSQNRTYKSLKVHLNLHRWVKNKQMQRKILASKCYTKNIIADYWKYNSWNYGIVYV